jgi:hypothetical protein
MLPMIQLILAELMEVLLAMAILVVLVLPLLLVLHPGAVVPEIMLLELAVMLGNLAEATGELETLWLVANWQRRVRYRSVSRLSFIGSII